MSEPAAGRRQKLPWPVAAGAVFAFLFCAAYNILIFDRVPHIHDETVYLFQARIFLGGGVTAPLPPVPEAFDFPHVVNVGRWYTIYPPGFPFLLALGLLVGAPWLVNPILAAFAVLLFYWLGTEIYDRRTGVLASILGALSIWLLLMSSTMMSHTASMVFNAVFLLFFFRSLRAPTFRNGLAAGASLGLAFLIRPYNAAVFALPFLIVLAVRTLARLKLRWKNALALALAGILALGIFLAYNAATTGDPLKPGYIARYGQAYSVIFGRAATLDYDFTPLVAAIQIGENMAAINKDLFGWPLTSLWLLPFALWAFRRRKEERGRDLLLLAGFLSMVVGFFFFWGAFVVLGARMFFDALPLLVLLSAKGLRRAPELLAARTRRFGEDRWRKALAVVLAVFSLYAFAFRFPRWVAPSWTEWFYERYDQNMCGSSAWIHNALAPLGLRNAVVVMKLLYAPLTGFPTGWWGSGFLYDTPRLDGDVLFANDRGDATTLGLMQAYPGRAFYAYVGTLEKGLLVPLSQEVGAVRRGRPIVPPVRPRRSVELLAEPESLFKMYGPGFRAFVEDVLRGDGWVATDVESLRTEGLRLLEARNFRKAAYSLEAALQLEKNPKVRWPMLVSLGQCYMKTGQTAEAKRIMAKFEESDFKGRRLFFILPDRGF
ncbi:MAG: glycosyltransferase family 39 protein [Candidatus Aminicenantes bacterium]|nr:glycosyltransferase family 39 protein [Candidatus Aminicenantes bacterium]